MGDERSIPEGEVAGGGVGESGGGGGKSGTVTGVGAPAGGGVPGSGKEIGTGLVGIVGPEGGTGEPLPVAEGSSGQVIEMLFALVLPGTTVPFGRPV
jgi:hypothetical protein